VYGEISTKAFVVKVARDETLTLFNASFECLSSDIEGEWEDGERPTSDSSVSGSFVSHTLTLFAEDESVIGAVGGWARLVSVVRSFRV